MVATLVLVTTDTYTPRPVTFRQVSRLVPIVCAAGEILIGVEDPVQVRRLVTPPESSLRISPHLGNHTTGTKEQV